MKRQAQAAAAPLSLGFASLISCSLSVDKPLGGRYLITSPD